MQRRCVDSLPRLAWSVIYPQGVVDFSPINQHKRSGGGEVIMSSSKEIIILDDSDEDDNNEIAAPVSRDSVKSSSASKVTVETSTAARRPILGIAILVKKCVHNLGQSTKAFIHGPDIVSLPLPGLNINGANVGLPCDINHIKDLIKMEHMSCELSPKSINFQNKDFCSMVDQIAAKVVEHRFGVASLPFYGHELAALNIATYNPDGDDKSHFSTFFFTVAIQLQCQGLSKLLLQQIVSPTLSQLCGSK